MHKQSVCILGSTGSIGVSTLDVIARHPERYQVFALSAHTQVQKLAEQCRQFQPQFAVVANTNLAAQLRIILDQMHSKTQVMAGADALCAIASDVACDTVMAAIVGAAGLAPSLAAARAGKKILLANKEALVMSGALFMNTVKEHGAQLLPIDSEHNAIFQCLPRQHDASLGDIGVSKIILTASGGPFLQRSLESLHDVTPDEAIAHPNWVMGRKISVDSATMMNKGLEVIEAHYLFTAPAEKIEVLIHPQSVVHSMVSYTDGSVLAQMGNPDMRTPIAYGLAFPERVASGVAQLDLTRFAHLHFQKPDFDRFPCLALAYEALKVGGFASTILNAANEIAVEAFLAGRLGFRSIEAVISETLADAVGQVGAGALTDLESVLAVDGLARRCAESQIAKRGVNYVE